MTATTINTFPSLHSWSSPRGWALAIIVLLHVGFVWVLSSGLSVSIITKVFKPEPPTLIEPVEKIRQPPPKPLPSVEPKSTVFVPKPAEPKLVFDEIPDTAPVMVDTDPTPPGVFTDAGGVSPPAPVIVEPSIDARRGLSEPLYPATEIRQGHEGTVTLLIHVLADGRVGEVRLVQSSGFAKLDESALREAKRWRLVPGTRDGQAAAMWKQIPITFRLNQ
jgi:periplasmic protein TonB